MCLCRVKKCIQDQFKIWITFCEDLFLLFLSLSTKLFVSDNKHIHTYIIIKNLLHSLLSWDFTGLIMPVWYQVASSLLASSSYVKSVKTRFDAIWCLHTCFKLLIKLTSSLWIKNFDNQLASSLVTTCSRLVIMPRTNESKASWCQLDDCKVCNCKITSLQQTFYNLSVSGCV